MRIKFCGAARTVTGSQHLLSVNGKRILLDCGLYQGRRKDTYQWNKNFLYDPGEVDVALLSHAHIDHCGNLPNLFKKAFRGSVFATSATVDLCQIMLRDSAYLQARDAEWVNRNRRKKKRALIEPLYTVEDVEEALKSLVGVQYQHPFEVIPGVHATFLEAGHILGSAGILLEMEDGKRKIRLGFSGDIGRSDVPILRDPEPLKGLDALIMESTYGNRNHSVSEDVEDVLTKVIRETAEAGGNIIIPAFAVGRTQRVVYTFHKLFRDKRLPELPIFVDSPMALNATAVFRTHPECFDADTYRLFLDEERDPFGFDRLRYVRSVEESKKLNSLRYPHVIISASGMAEGGRVLHHLKNNIGSPKNLVLFVGYAAQHTLARRLMDGADEVRIFGELQKVRCRAVKIDDFSAHADRRDLIRYVGQNSPSKLKNIFLVHGEPDQAEPLQEALGEKGYSSVQYPTWGQEFEV